MRRPQSAARGEGMAEQAKKESRWLGWARSHRLLLTISAHLVLFAASWMLAFGLAYNFRGISTWFSAFFLPLLPIVLSVKMAVFMFRGLHRGSWRYVSLRDVMQITWASWWSFFFIFVAYYLIANLPSLLTWLGYKD